LLTNCGSPALLCPDPQRWAREGTTLTRDRCASAQRGTGPRLQPGNTGTTLIGGKTLTGVIHTWLRESAGGDTRLCCWPCSRPAAVTTPSRAITSRRTRRATPYS